MLKKYRFDPKKFKLGMRTVKTGLAVFLLAVLFSFRGFDGLQIAALSAVFSLREDFDKSVHFGSSRVLSNSLGGFYALLYLWLMDFFPGQSWVTLIFIPIFTMLTIMTNYAMNNKAGIVSGVATMLIIALSIPAGDSFLYALSRVLETFVGVFVAILVNSDIDKLRKALKPE